MALIDDITVAPMFLLWEDHIPLKLNCVSCEPCNGKLRGIWLGLQGHMADICVDYDTLLLMVN